MRCSGESSVSENYVAIVRRVLRHILLEKKKYPTVREVYRRLSKLTTYDVLSLNLYEDKIPPSYSKVWSWSMSTLFRCMQRSGFVYDDRATHYEVTKTREDIVSMRDNYLE